MKIRIIIIYVFIVFLLHIIHFGSGVEFDDLKLLNIRADYLIHMIIFFPWMGLIKLSLHEKSTDATQVLRSGVIHQKLFRSFKQLNQSPLIWLLIGILLATVAEVIQLWLPYRSFNILDLMSGIIGIILGCIVYVDRLFSS